MKDTLKTFKDTQIPNTPYNWHIWKRAYAMGYKESESIKKPKQMNGKQMSEEKKQWKLVFEAYGKPFTSGRHLWDWLKENCDIKIKNQNK